MYELPAVQISATDRATATVLLAEVIATAGLVRSGRASLCAAAVGAYIGAPFWFTSSTSLRTLATAESATAHC